MNVGAAVCSEGFELMGKKIRVSFRCCVDVVWEVEVRKSENLSSFDLGRQDGKERASGLTRISKASE